MTANALHNLVPARPGVRAIYLVEASQHLAVVAGIDTEALGGDVSHLIKKRPQNLVRPAQILKVDPRLLYGFAVLRDKVIVGIGNFQLARIELDLIVGEIQGSRIAGDSIAPHRKHDRSHKRIVRLAIAGGNGSIGFELFINVFAHRGAWLQLKEMVAHRLHGGVENRPAEAAVIESIKICRYPISEIETPMAADRSSAPIVAVQPHHRRAKRLEVGEDLNRTRRIADACRQCRRVHVGEQAVVPLPGKPIEC